MVQSRKKVAEPAPTMIYTKDKGNGGTSLGGSFYGDSFYKIVDKKEVKGYLSKGWTAKPKK